LLLILGLLYPVACMIGPIVREKQLRQKELMKMMSVTESDIGWSWFISYFYFHFITATIVALISTVLYEKSDGIYLWFFFVLGFTSVIVFCMTIATLTAKPTRAILIGLLLFFAGVFLTIVTDFESGSEQTIGLISLHPVAAMSYGLQEIGYLEDEGIGLKSSSIGNTDKPSKFTFSKAIRYLLFDLLLWGFLCYYLNRVITPDYGQARPWYFPCQALARCFRKKPAVNLEDERANGASAADANVPIEPVSDALRKQAAEGTNLEIYNLRKTFNDKHAVDGLTLSMYRGQVTALLGHNGAGKTTTISMLTGALAPTEGYARVAGKDIRVDMDEIRRDIGICLQHDCLFPQLTVREHLQFFSRLKGLYTQYSKKEAEDHIDQVLHDVALMEKRNTFSRNLSGGMKRKLSVAIAFCGNSQVVLLDEPTSGMDPFSRRFTWNVIRQYRQDRVIILTTHFMDEADILGDRIAIMAEGQLRCCGSSLFLKKTYGVGYQLTIEKYTNSDNIKNADGTQHVMKSTDRDDLLMGIVKDAVPEANLLSNVGSEMSYQLPLGAAPRFAQMFEGLDDQVEKKHITTYGVGITTLDEVFLLVARGEHKEKERQHFASSKRLNHNTILDSDSQEKSVRSRMDLEKDNLFFTHVNALFRKRAANFRRDKKAWLCTTILPSLFVMIGLFIFTFGAPTRNLSPIALSFDGFNADVKVEPNNPIMYNQGGNRFTCQPGRCIYGNLDINEPDPRLFCGFGAKVDNTCSVQYSDTIMDTLSDVGDPIGYSPRTILQVSDFTCS
jgi:ATP-binding cassette, subfamily A (ABC1), member 3